MTELQALLTFLLGVRHVYSVQADCDRIQNVLNHVYLYKDKPSFERFLVSLMALDDAIVVGLNTGRFEWKEHGAFSLFPHSCLPKFLRGVLSKVFDDEGNLRNDYTKDDLAILEGLRLVRRTKFAELGVKSREKAIQTFVNFQRQVRQTNGSVVDDMRQLWAIFAPESRFRGQLQLGFPGPGAMHDVSYPHVPQLCFVDHNTIPDPLVAGIMSDALALQLKSFAFDHHFPDCPYITIYPFKRGIRVSTLVTVPKTCLTDRAITITDPDAVIIGATLRVSLFNVVEWWGWRDVLNVHDQSISQRCLNEHFDTISLADVEGGTGCLKIDTMTAILPEYATKMFNCSKSDYFSVEENPAVNRPFVIPCKKAQSKELQAIFKKIDLLDLSTQQSYEDPDLPLCDLGDLNGVEKITTLAQGDSSSVALLTITLGLALALGVYYEDFSSYPLNFDTLSTIAQLMRKDKRFHVVGDDMIFPSRFEASIRYVLVGLGVTINERKSSGMTGRYKETCGNYAVRLPDGTHEPIYPNRHPDKQNLSTVRMQATQEFIQRTKNSSFSLELALAVMAGVTHPYLEEYESYDLSCVGSPFGYLQPTFKYATFSGQPERLADEIAYAFGIDPTRFFPKLSSTDSQLAIGFRPLKDSPHPLFVSFARSTRLLCSGQCSKKQHKTGKKVSKSKNRKIDNPRPSVLTPDMHKFLLALLHCSRSIVLFA